MLFYFMKRNEKAESVESQPYCLMVIIKNKKKTEMHDSQIRIKCSVQEHCIIKKYFMHNYGIAAHNNLQYFLQ